ncbi:MAG TPA: ABC transporter permease [Candidatus Deferrimicrobiaceae bacterium]|nr:ABC transporter permease [Candidatus Deferrimicrobiaceae bacterium]
MSARRIAAVARRIAQGFRRDERTLGLVFVVPIVIIALLGWVLSEQKGDTARVAVVNEAGLIGDRIVAALEGAAADADEPLTVETAADADAARAAIRAAEIDLAIVIPEGLEADIAAGNRPTLTVISEGTDPGAEAGRFGRLQSLMADLASQLTIPGAPPPLVPKIEAETVYLSPEAGTVDVLAPVFLGYFGYFFVFLLTGISFLRERIGGTLERLLATPVTRGEIVLGYTLGFGLFATLQVIVLTLFILNAVDVPEIGPIPAFTIGLGVESVGSPFLTFAIALVLSLGAVSLGIFLSTFARTELQVIQFIPIVIIPQGVLGGIFWPIDQLPDILAAIARVLPMTYAVDGLREVMLKGADLASSTVQLDLAVLSGIAVVFVLLAAATIKREVA